MTKYTYRKRIGEVEAFQMTQGARWCQWGWPHWLWGAWNRPETEVGALFADASCPRTKPLWLRSPCGVLRSVPWDYYIIRDSEGHLELWSPSFFEAQYKRAGSGEDEDRRQGERRCLPRDRRRPMEDVRGRRTAQRFSRRNVASRRTAEPTDD